MRELATGLSGPGLLNWTNSATNAGHSWRPGTTIALRPWASPTAGSRTTTPPRAVVCCAGFTSRWIQDRRSLVRVALGRAFDVVVDVRRASGGFGRWEAFELIPEPPRVLYVPPGFAHGFCALDDETHLLYKVSVHYDASRERGLAWNDQDVGIEWPVAQPILSPRDRSLPGLGGLPVADQGADGQGLLTGCLLGRGDSRRATTHH